MSDLREDLEKFTKPQLIDGILYLLSEDIEVRGYNSYVSQVSNIITYCEENNLVSNISDKDDKRYDRGKSWLKEIPDMIASIKRIRKDLLSIEEKVKVKEDAGFNSIEAFLKKAGK